MLLQIPIIIARMIGMITFYWRRLVWWSTLEKTNQKIADSYNVYTYNKYYAHVYRREHPYCFMECKLWPSRAFFVWFLDSWSVKDSLQCLYHLREYFFLCLVAINQQLICLWFCCGNGMCETVYQRSSVDIPGPFACSISRSILGTFFSVSILLIWTLLIHTRFPNSSCDILFCSRKCLMRLPNQ